MQNPYKQTSRPPALKRICCDVSEDDWRHLKQLIPEQGVQDIVLSNLFHNFFIELRSLNLTIPTDPNGFTQIKNQLSELVRRRSNPPTA